MMNTMRSFASGFIAKLLMLFLVVTFGVWGIGDMFRDSGSSYAARVGKETISVAEFARAKNAIQRRAEAMGMKDIGSALDVGVLRQLIQQRLVNLTMQDLGLYSNTALIAKALKEDATFKNPDGSFNKAAFTGMLKSQHISEGEVLRQIGDELKANFLMSSLDVSDIAYPSAMRALEATSALEMRDAWLITIAPAAAPTIIDEAALNAFYEQNKSVLYAKPESRTLEYVVLRQAQLDALIDQSITESVLASAKQKQPNASTAEIKAQLRKTQREQTMQQLRTSLEDALAGGATLAQALEQAKIPGALQTLTDVREESAKTAADDVSKTVIEQGFHMSEGETSGLLFSKAGAPMIVHVKAVKPSGAQEYKLVARDVHDRVSEQMRRDAARARVQEVKEAISKITGDTKQPSEADIQAALAPFQLKARGVTGLVRPQPRSTPSREIPPLLLQAIFERQPGSVAGPLSLTSGSQMLAIVSAIRYPDAATVEARAKTISPQERQALSEQLRQSVLARSFASFAAKHSVRINSKLLTQNAEPAEENQ